MVDHQLTMPICLRLRQMEECASTGDFRTHGFRGKGVKPTLEKYVKG